MSAITEQSLSELGFTTWVEVSVTSCNQIVEFLTRSVDGFHAGVPFIVIGRTAEVRRVYLNDAAVRRLVSSELQRAGQQP